MPYFFGFLEYIVLRIFFIKFSLDIIFLGLANNFLFFFVIFAVPEFPNENSYSIFLRLLK